MHIYWGELECNRINNVNKSNLDLRRIYIEHIFVPWISEYFTLYLLQNILLFSKTFTPVPKCTQQCARMCNNGQKVKIRTGPRGKKQVHLWGQCNREVSPNVASSWTRDPIQTLRQKIKHTQNTEDCILKHHSQSSEQTNELAMQLSILAFLTY